MNDFVTRELANLRENYLTITGREFEHFYCPILYRDEDTPLCEAHIINEALSNVSRTTTVQRADIDGFYGSRFEADAMDVEVMHGKTTQEILANPDYARRFNASIYRDGERVDTFYTKGRHMPPNSTPLIVPGRPDHSTAFMALKMNEQEIIEAQDKDWHFEIKRDIGIHLIVSVLKMAHLTLFSLYGYRYAFTTGGYRVGKILGDFFENNRGLRKPEVVQNARDYFFQFRHMVRPLKELEGSWASGGTLSDEIAYLCHGGSGHPWGMVVIVSTGTTTHGALLPVGDTVGQLDAFQGFLSNNNETLRVSTCMFDKFQNIWKISPNVIEMKWLKTGVDEMVRGDFPWSPSASTEEK